GLQGAGGKTTVTKEIEMDDKRNGSRPSGKGPAEWFTGSVRVDPLLEAAEPAHGRGASVTFELTARTAWHTHPLGQTPIRTPGVGSAALGRPYRRNPTGRRGLVPAWRETLARRRTDDRDDAYRYSGGARLRKWTSFSKLSSFCNCARRLSISRRGCF